MIASPRLALIDDDRTWLETLAEYLRDKGYGVETASAGGADCVFWKPAASRWP